MLQLDHICKSYTTNDFTQVALDNVSLAFRDNEFVSILGQSGSGKTTMLNVIGGLDHFDSGDLLIDGVSTREYRDRDWDTYRNNRIGFVFQSYNLIPHQTILANVELALTLSGVSPAERKERAREALAQVGLAEHVDKRPSQLSGGQMQRVAIARALINDPEILLADEPTGALDSKTSVQVMDLLKEVASDRLVIMVTHNPELAYEYSTRIVELADGRIRSDSDPFEPTEADMREAKPPRRTSMSFATALSLSFNNLMTKKGRTIMTAFAGSIGIIGIAAILALANGVNAYIQEVEEDTLSIYPLQIMSSGFDMTSMLMDVETGLGQSEPEERQDASGGSEGASDPKAQKAQGEEGRDAQNRVRESRIVANMFGRVGKNDLAALKEFIESNCDDISSYVQDVEYQYGLVPQIFNVKGDDVYQVNPDSSFSALGFGGSSSSAFMSSSFTTNVFSEMPADRSLFEGQYDIRAGRWPDSYDELVLVLSRTGASTDFVSYAMGLRDHNELKTMVQQFADQEEVHAPTDQRYYTYDQLLDVGFRVVPANEFYAYEPEYKVWTSKVDDKDYMRKLVMGSQKLKIVGIVQPKEDVDATSLRQGIYYTPKLTKWLMDKGAESKIVKEQLANPSVNVISGKSFDQELEEEGEKFDMSSLFSIDEEKMKDAFGVDTSKLDLSGLDLSGLGGALDLSNMAADLDLSGMDLSTLDIDWNALPMPDLSGVRLDVSAFDLSGVDLSQLFDPAMLAAIAPAFASLDPAKVFEGVEPTVSQDKLLQLVTFVQNGLRTYLMEHPVDPSDSQATSAAIGAYFSQPDVVEQMVQSSREIVTITAQDQRRIAQNLQTQLADATKKLSEADRQRLGEDLARLAERLSGDLGRQFSEVLGAQLGVQLGQALAASVGTMLESAISQTMERFMTNMATTLQERLGTALNESLQGSMEKLMSGFADAMQFDEEVFAQAFQTNMTDKELGQLMMSLLSTERTSYDNNLSKLGYAEESKPTQIDIYPRNFEAKSSVIGILDNYNSRMREAGEEGKVITYTDIVGVLMTSVTEIVNMISYVLIAFVAISLVVSSIMIGVITYISVLERKKEIGILRSIGASKRDVSNVFNAETVIEGLVSGLMGVGITALICIPANIIVNAAVGVERVARLPLGAAIILVFVSVALSFVAGVLPARSAAKADPVEALRSE